MLISLYKPGTSLCTAPPAGLKIVLLFIFCTLLFLLQSWWFLAGAIVVVLAAYLLANLSLALAWQAVRPALWVLALIFLVQVWLNDWQFGLYVVLRFAIMIVAATLLTLTSKTSEMIEGIERSVTKVFCADVAEKVGPSLFPFPALHPHGARNLSGGARGAKGARAGPQLACPDHAHHDPHPQVSRRYCAGD